MIDLYQQKIISDSSFDEEQWMKVLFLISDTQEWLNDLQRKIIYQVPFQNKRKVFQKSYYLSVTALAHILERHYYKIQRYPCTSKFIIPISEIVSFIRDALEKPPEPVNGTNNFFRVIYAGKVIGTNPCNQMTDAITIITDIGGQIITAFPGVFQNKISNEKSFDHEK